MAGFNLDLSQGSAAHDGKLETFAVADTHATLLAPGDVIRLAGSADDEGVATVDAAGATGSITGIIASVKPQFVGENLTETGLPASTAGRVRCHVDPNLNFIVNVTNGTLTAANVGQNINAVVTAATKSGGLTVSNMTVDAATAATTASLQFRILGLEPNDAGAIDGTRARVRMNNSTMRAGTTGV